jgi:hypothetical protein
MKPLPPTPELLRVARRVVWFKDPAEALAEPVHLLAHAMTYGTIEDIAVLEAAVGRDGFRQALEQAPPGIFDPRSWSYWNLVLGRSPAPPLPRRSFQRADADAGRS